MSGPAVDDSTRTRTAALKAHARGLGFAGVGVARLDAPGPGAAPDPAADHYRAWLARGDHGEMIWLNRMVEERAHPRTLWPAARSLVAVAWNYHRPDEPTGHAGHFARYARGRDYHRAVGSRLKALAREARLLWPGATARTSVDTGPFLERAWAERAGIGFIGKHAHVIHRESGNWALLGELVLDVALTPDAPAVRRCGTCERCMNACPTGALPAPYRVDARRCISYLTIELHGAIPADLRPLVGERIFGCDDCLDACPWNRFAQAAELDEVRARPGLLTTPLAEWLALDEPAFRAHFVGTAVLRAGRDGFLRNVCVALGNRRDPSAVPALAHALAADPSALVRAHAAWALGRIGGAAARAALAAAGAGEADAGCRAEIAAACASGAGGAASRGRCRVRDRLSACAFSGLVPVFPLPEVVFFPGTMLPLHVFEPRYLALVQDATAGEGLIAMATLLPGWEDDAGGAPPFHPLATVGRIEAAEALDDGRMNIRLLGLERTRLEEDWTDLPYRRARARLEPDEAVDEADAEIVELKGRLLAAYEYLAQLVGGGRRARVIPSAAVPFESAVHTLCQTLDLPLRDKLMALEAEGPVARVPFARRALIESLERALASHGLPGVRLGANEGN